jgi:tetratricopeptide (TPR) repeat protein
VEHYNKALTIQKQQKAPLASTYQSLADVYKNLGELNTASNYYEMAIESLNREKPEEESVDYYEDLCLVHKNLGIIQRRLNLFDRAMDNLNRSLDLYNKFLDNGGEHDGLRRGIFESMAKLHEETGNTVMAEECRAKKEKTTTDDALP